MACNETLTTQAWFDKELEADAARTAERHIETCPDCAKLLRELEGTRSALKANASYHRADAHLRARILDALDEETGARVRLAAWRGRPFWAGTLSGAVATAAAAAVAVFLLLPGDADEIADSVTGAHLRSLMGTHLVDVASGDPAVLRPWLARHTAVAAPVADLSAHGYMLVGAREDYIYESGAGVAVYKRGSHVINVFAWTAHEDEDLPDATSDNGTNIVFWRKGNVVYCAVSNIAMNDLKGFADLLRA